MKKFCPIVLSIVVLFLFLTSCAKPAEPFPTNQSELAKAGMFGNHKLEIIGDTRVIEGSVTGRFFIGGYIDGQVDSPIKITFRWSSLEGQYLISDLPQSKFVTIIDETKIVPEVEFVFDEDWLPYCFERNQDLQCTLVTDPSKVNLNTYLQSENLMQVRVYISSAGRKLEPSLP